MASAQHSSEVRQVSQSNVARHRTAGSGSADLDAWSRDALQFQRIVGNNSLGAAIGRQSSNIHRAGLMSFTLLQRAIVQRDGPDPDDPFKDPTKRPDPITGPGGPGDVGDKGLTCGFKNGKFTCSVDPGTGDPLELPGDWSSYGPKTPDAGGMVGPNSCPPGMYNKLWNKCCPTGTHADSDGLNCVKNPAEQSVPLPPPEPTEPGDFPVPDPNADQQVA